MDILKKTDRQKRREVVVWSVVGLLVSALILVVAYGFIIPAYIRWVLR